MNRDVLVNMIHDLKRYVMTTHDKSYKCEKCIDRSDLQYCLFMISMSLNQIENYAMDGKVEDD